MEQDVNKISSSIKAQVKVTTEEWKLLAQGEKKMKMLVKI